MKRTKKKEIKKGTKIPIGKKKRGIGKKASGVAAKIPFSL